MLRYENKGYIIEIKLPKNEEYSVECRYKYDKSKEKYLLSMWLKREDIDDTYKIDSQEIDTQYISGTKDTVKRNICKIVEQAASKNFFDFYIERYECTYQCYERGNELYEKERLSGANTL